jgi:hypothetical protein
MFADVSNWELTIPSGTSNVKDGDDEIRRMKTLLDSGLQTEHYWLDSGISGGQHKPGSSRLSYGSTGPPLTGDEGRVFYHVAKNQLVIQGSSATTQIGGGRGGTAFVTTNTVTVPTHTLSIFTFGAPNWVGSGMTVQSGSSQFGITEPGEYRINVNFRGPWLSNNSEGFIGIGYTDPALGAFVTKSGVSGAGLPGGALIDVVAPSSAISFVVWGYQTSGAGAAMTCEVLVERL